MYDVLTNNIFSSRNSHMYIKFHYLLHMYLQFQNDFFFHISDIFHFFWRNILQTHVFKLVKVHSTKQKNTSDSPLIMSFWTNTKFHIFHIITIIGWGFQKYRFFTKKHVFFQYEIPICTFIFMIFPICMFNFKTCVFIDISDIFRFFAKKWKITYCIKIIKSNIFESNSPYVTVISEITKNIKKLPFITILEKNMFFQNFSKMYILKKPDKKHISSE